MDKEGRVLVVIDMQNDYFPGGLFPLWHSEAALHAVEEAMKRARSLSIPIVLVQHVADPRTGLAPFFNHGSKGVEIHPAALSAAPGAPVVVKGHADAFAGTNLEEVLSGLGARHLLLCGMMTQNCVTHTALSKSAEKYAITILTDCCTTVSEILHRIALNALSSRVALVAGHDALATA